MYYYKRNIGDYHKKAGRLSILQHGAYTLLLDACYDREEFPTLGQAIEWVWASNKDEIDAVEFVLGRFFDLVDGKYIQNRIQDELDSFHEKSEKNRRIALDREEKRRKRKQGVHETCSEEHEAPPNHKPLTTNHKPLIKTLDQQVDRDDLTEKSKDSAMDEITPLFETFWSSGIRKVGKKQSLGVFKKILANKSEKKEFTDFLINDVKSRLDGGQLGFAEMHPTTYLRNERWEDELPAHDRGPMGDIVKVSEVYNRVLGDVLPENKLPTNEMAENLKFIKLHQERFRALEEWERFFGYVRGCHFLIGETPAQKSGENNFVANLSWLLKPENFGNCIGGKYESR